MLQLMAPALTSLFVTFIAMVALRPLAIAIDLVDKPGGRKTHHGNVPVFGGLAMLLGMLVGFGVLPGSDQTGAVFSAACALLVTTGLLDDRFDISPWARLPVQAAAATLICLGSNAVVHTLGSPFAGAEVVLTGAAGLLVTLVLVMGAINAFNMLDGMDGLAGATALVGLLGLGYLSWHAGLAQPLYVSLVAAGAVVAFLVFNLPARYNRAVRCFMGDAGSTLLGFVLAWLCIAVSQAPSSPVDPVVTLWLVAMPLYELIWSTMRRLVRGVSPFRADRDHFHHLLLGAGLGVRGAFFVFVGLAVLLAAAGLACDAYGVSDGWSLVLFLACGAGVVVLMYHARVLLRFVPASMRRPTALDLVAETATPRD
jgi:UDP-GlcNAc:undecaprenyl-phosphate GlcNAc-1-phosphate transferase